MICGWFSNFPWQKLARDTHGSTPLREAHQSHSSLELRRSHLLQRQWSTDLVGFYNQPTWNNMQKSKWVYLIFPNLLGVKISKKNGVPTNPVKGTNSLWSALLCLEPHKDHIIPAFCNSCFFLFLFACLYKKKRSTAEHRSDSVLVGAQTPSLLLICSLYKWENGLPLLICSSLSTAQCFTPSYSSHYKVYLKHCTYH